MATEYHYDKESNSYVPESESDVSRDERVIGILLWGMVLLDITLVPFIISVVAYFYFKNKSNFLANIAREVVNFQISIVIYSIITVILAIITLTLSSIILLPLLILYNIIIPIIGIYQAYKYRVYFPRFTIRVLK